MCQEARIAGKQVPLCTLCKQEPLPRLIDRPSRTFGGSDGGGASAPRFSDAASATSWEANGREGALGPAAEVGSFTAGRGCCDDEINMQRRRVSPRIGSC